MIPAKVLGLKPGIEPRPARLRPGYQAGESVVEFWEDHPEIARGAVTWQLSRQYGPRSLEQLLRMQKIMNRLAKK